MTALLHHGLGQYQIRYYGLWHPARREQAARARLLLQLDQPTAAGGATSASEANDGAAETSASGAVEPLRTCPSCKQGRLVPVGRLYPRQASGP